MIRSALYELRRSRSLTVEAAAETVGRDAEDWEEWEATGLVRTRTLQDIGTILDAEDELTCAIRAAEAKTASLTGALTIDAIVDTCSIDREHAQEWRDGVSRPVTTTELSGLAELLRCDIEVVRASLFGQQPAATCGTPNEDEKGDGFGGAANAAHQLHLLPQEEDGPRGRRDWQRSFVAFSAFCDAHGRLPTFTEEWEGIRVGQFVSNQQRDYRRQTMQPDRMALLETFPGWEWREAERHNQDIFEERVAALEAYAAEHGTSLVPNGVEAADVDDLFRWTQSLRRESERLAETSRRRLESLPDWTWDPETARWQLHYRDLADQLRAGAELEELDPSQARWVTKQRKARREGRLSSDQIVALEALPSWAWVSPVESAAIAAQRLLTVLQYGHGLGDHERTVLEKRMLSDAPMTLEDVGEHLGMSREGTRQVEVKLLARALHPVTLVRHRQLEAIGRMLPSGLHRETLNCIRDHVGDVLRWMAPETFNARRIEALLVDHPADAQRLLARADGSAWVRVERPSSDDQYLGELPLDPDTWQKLYRGGIAWTKQLYRARQDELLAVVTADELRCVLSIVEAPVVAGPAVDGMASSRVLLAQSIRVLGLSERPKNCLRRVRVETVGELVAMTEDELLDIRNFGEGSLNEVISTLRKHGLSLAGIGTGPQITRAERERHFIPIVQYQLETNGSPVEITAIYDHVAKHAEPRFIDGDLCSHTKGAGFEWQHDVRWALYRLKEHGAITSPEPKTYVAASPSSQPAA